MNSKACQSQVLCGEVQEPDVKTCAMAGCTLATGSSIASCGAEDMDAWEAAVKIRLAELKYAKSEEEEPGKSPLAPKSPKYDMPDLAKGWKDLQGKIDKAKDMGGKSEKERTKILQEVM